MYAIVRLILMISYGLDSPKRLDNIRRVSERRQSHVTLPCRPETGAGGRYNVRLVEKQVEEFPRADALRRFQPDIRRVDAAINLVAQSR